MKKSKLLINLSFCALTFIAILILNIMTFEKKDLTIIANSNTEASKYAAKHHLNLEIISESEQANYNLNLDSFTYNKSSNGITITNYNGISKKVIIPTSINNIPVIALAKNAFASVPNLEEITISPNITSLNEEDYSKVKINCYQKSSYCLTLKDNENLNINLLSDSLYKPLNLLDPLEFTYNTNNNEITITKYNLDEKEILIPNFINGYQVTKLDLDLNGIKSIYIPASVTNINLSLPNNYDFLFIFSIISDLIALTIVLIIINTIKTITKEDNFNAAPSRILATIYLLFVLIYTTLAKINAYNLKLTIIITIVSTIIYLLISISLLNAKKQITEYDTKIKNIDQFIKEALNILAEIENNDPNITKELENIKDLIKYSDPVSSPNTKEIETEIINLLKDNSNKDITYYQKISKLITKRNNICKENK